MIHKKFSGRLCCFQGKNNFKPSIVVCHGPLVEKVQKTQRHQTEIKKTSFCDLKDCLRQLKL